MVRIRVPRKYGVQREIELERSRQNADFNRRLKNAEDSMRAIYPEEYKKIRSRYFGNGNNLGLIGSQYNYIHDMITRRSDDQMKNYYNELNDYFIKQTGTQPGYMLPGVDVVDDAPDFNALRQKDFDRFYSPTDNSDYLNSVEKQNARNAYLALQNRNADGTFDNDGYFDYDPNNGLLNTEANYARATGSYNYTPEERKAAATWERAENSPIITAMEFSPLFPVVAGVKAVAAANAPQASGVDVGMNAVFAALPAVGAGVKAIKKAINSYNDLHNGFKPVLKNYNGNLRQAFKFEPIDISTNGKRIEIPLEEKKQIAKDISSGIKYVSDYYGSPAYRIRSRKAKLPINDIIISNNIHVDPNFDNANSVMWFGKKYANGDVAAHEVAHNNKIFNTRRNLRSINNDFVIQPEKNLDLSVHYNNDYSKIPTKIKQVLKPDVFNNLHDTEISEAYSDLMSLRKSLEQNLDIDGLPYYSSTKETGMPDVNRLKRYFANGPDDEIAKRYFVNHTNNTGDKIDYKKIAKALKIVPGVALPVAGGIGISNIYDSNNNDEQQYYKSGGIHIPESHRGRLTRLKERTGKSEEELYRTGDKHTRQMITFARNARKWKHADGGDVPPFKSFDDWYRSIYHNANDTTDYNLRRAYELAPIGELEAWRSDPDKNHLHSGYWNGDVYEFMKSKDHPTVNYELDWYNSHDADDFRSRYMLDTTTGNYKYVPRYKVKVTF